MIGIVDYGMGNLRSVANAFAELDLEAKIFAAPEQVRGIDRIVLPGVGAFSEAIACLRATGMAEALTEFVAAGRPLLGICLGMQLICTRSAEDGDHAGLGWIEAEVRSFDPSLGIKVPHMGWNSLEARRGHPILDALADGADVYFVHSYYASCGSREDVLATSRHGIEFAAIIGRDNVLGMQFHPEKSQQVGLELLRNFSIFG